MTKTKIAIGAVALIAAIYFIDRGVSYVRGVLGENKRLHTELVGKSKEYKQLSARAAELEIKYADQVALAKALNETFAEEKLSLQGRIKVLSNATFLIREKARQSNNSDISYQGQALKYVVNEVRFNDGPPVGYVLIFDDGRVVSKIYNHAIDVKTAVARDEDSGQYSIVSRADYILKSPSINSNGEQVWTNKPFALKITGGSAVVDPTEKNQTAPRFQWFAFHVNGGLAVGAGAGGVFVRPTVDFSFSGYGPSKRDLDWKFIHLGFDVDSALTDPGVHLAPFSYRFWPSVLSNTYVGPAIGWSKAGLNGQLGLNVTF